MLASTKSHKRKLSLTQDNSFPVIVDWERLPCDVLLLIFDYIAINPRLFYVSLVSKRWRSLVLCTITCIGYHHTLIERKRETEAFALLPSVTDLAIASSRFSPAPLIFSSSLKTLRLGSYADGIEPTISFATPFPPLVRFDIRASAWNVLKILPVLGPLMSTLTALDLFVASDNTELDRFNLYFPQLIELSLGLADSRRHGARDELFINLARNHASQLTSLAFSMLDRNMENEIIVLPFPRLTALKIDSELDGEDLGQLLSHCPLLKEFHSVTSTILEVTPTELLSSLTCMDLTTGLDFAPSDVLHHCPNLRELRVVNDNRDLLAAIHHANLEHLVTEALATWKSADDDIIGDFLNLRELTLTFENNVRYFPPFPKLTSLTLWMYSVPFGDALSYAITFVDALPALRRDFSASFSKPDKDLYPVLVVLLNTLKSRGVEKATLRFPVEARDSITPYLKEYLTQHWMRFSLGFFARSDISSE